MGVDSRNQTKTLLGIETTLTAELLQPKTPAAIKLKPY